MADTIKFTNKSDSPKWLQDAMSTECFICCAPDGWVQIEFGDQITKDDNGQLSVVKEGSVPKYYIKKIERVEVVQFTHYSNSPQWLRKALANGSYLWCEEKWVEVKPGDCVIKDNKGNLTVMNAAMFQQEYIAEDEYNDLISVCSTEKGVW